MIFPGDGRSFRHISLLIFAISVVCLSSCSFRDRPFGTDRIKGYVYYRVNNNPTTLDPAYIVDVSGGLIAAKLFNGLIRLNDDLGIVPDIAEKWDVLDSGKTYIFHLRKGVKFSTNQLVTAEDIKYSFKRILDPQTASPNTWALEKISGAKEFMSGKAKDITGIEVMDTYTLKLKLDRPFSPFLYLLTTTSAYIVPQDEVTKKGSDFSSSPVGSGPFIMKEWRHGSSVVLERNPSYFEDKAKAEGIVYRVIPEDLTAITEFELGNLDVLPIPASEFPRFRDSSKWKNHISASKGLNTYYIGFNCSRPPFDNVKLRRAAACAVDRERILNTFYEKRGRLSEGPVADLLRKWQVPGITSFDPEVAKKMIEEEAAQGRVVNFYVTADQEVVDIAEIIQSYLKRAGLDVRIKQLEWSAYKVALNNGEADMFWLSWWADYPDPENFLFPLFHSSNHGAAGNRTRYTNSEVDRRIVRGQEEIDLLRRSRDYGEAEKIIAGELPWIPFWHKTDFIVRQPGLRNYKNYPIYSMDKGLELSF